MPKKTVITHVYNEEFLLPHWLRHHRPMFDHGIVIDRRSTDRSPEIVRDLAPGWTLMQSRNPELDPYDCDREVMELERGIDGWKVVLNATELLLHHDLDGLLAAVEGAAGGAIMGVVPTPVVMVDRPGGPALTDDPLIEQRHHGYLAHFGDRYGRLRRRLLHRAPDGRYRVGRHQYDVRPLVDCPQLFSLWFGFSPYAKQLLARRAQQPATFSKRFQARVGLTEFQAVADDWAAQWGMAMRWSHDLFAVEGFRSEALAYLARCHGRRPEEPIAMPPTRLSTHAEVTLDGEPADPPAYEDRAG